MKIMAKSKINKKVFPPPCSIEAATPGSRFRVLNTQSVNVHSRRMVVMSSTTSGISYSSIPSTKLCWNCPQRRRPRWCSWQYFCSSWSQIWSLCSCSWRGSHWRCPRSCPYWKKFSKMFLQKRCSVINSMNSVPEMSLTTMASNVIILSKIFWELSSTKWLSKMFLLKEISWMFLPKMFLRPTPGKMCKSVVSG